MTIDTEHKPDHAIIDADAQLDVLRLVTCGSGGGGKSRLVAQLTGAASEIDEGRVNRAGYAGSTSAVQPQDTGFALQLDNLSDEYRQGMTIDVDYQHFATGQRKFIVADSPGHENYTRNMVSGASTADVAIIVVDVNMGILPQTRRHAFIASLLGIKYVVLAVNKMDQVNFNQALFQTIADAFEAFAQHLSFKQITAIPVSSLQGDNLNERSNQTPWYQGPTLLGALETVDFNPPENDRPFRFPVQQVIQSDSSLPALAGNVAAGSIRPGDSIRVLPSGEIAEVSSIMLGSSTLDTAITRQAVTIELNKDIEISRGDVLVTADNPCEVSDQFQASIIWMDREEGFSGRSYVMRIGSKIVNVSITDIKFHYNIENFEQLSSTTLKLNDIGELTISLNEAIPFESFQSCKTLGGFILIDPYSHETVAAGIINFSLRRAQNVHRQALVVDKKARATLSGHAGRALWFTGLSGSGKSTIANALEQKLHARGMHTYILDGDNVRHGLNKDLGFTDADRIENIRRIAEVAKLMVDAGLVVITSFISPFRSERDMARALFEPGEFVEIYIDVSLETAEKRDPKGLYKKARRGELPHFTGIDSDYEAPLGAEISLSTDTLSVDACVDKALAYLYP